MFAIRPLSLAALAAVAAVGICPQSSLSAGDPVESTAVSGSVARRGSVQDGKLHVQFTASDDVIANPGRGWYWSNQPETSTTIPLRNVDFYELEQQSITLIEQIYVLNNFRDRPIEGQFLRSMADDCVVARQQGVKLMPRFTYNWDRVGDDHADAAADLVLGHLQQLAPVLHRNTDVIAFYQTGFIGCEGRWYESSHGHIDPATRSLTESGRAIGLGILEAFPKSRMLTVSTAASKIDWFNEPISGSGTYGTEPRLRIGFSNQSLLTDSADKAFWSDDEQQRQQQMQYVEQDTQSVVMSGAIEMEDPAAFDRQLFLDRVERFHYTAMSVNEPGTAKVMQHLDEQGVKAELDRRLGYRYRLIEGQFPQQVQEGQEFELSLTFANDGYARPINRRGMLLELHSIDLKESLLVAVPLLDDIRTTLPGPGETKTLDLSGVVDDLMPGRYTVNLLFPDESPYLESRSVYNIRLANQDMWNERYGYNELKITIEVIAKTKS